MTLIRPEVRDAATLIVLREQTHVLMGQRSDTAAFMPGKFVFPGGAVDPGDAKIPVAKALNAQCAARLTQDSTLAPVTLAVTAIRELAEETGQRLSSPGDWPGAPPDWHSFATARQRPDASFLRFIFRAITPPGSPRRFDARFFLADAGNLSTDPDDFSAAAPELGSVQWVPLAQARTFDLPFITQIVLAELSARLRGHDPADIPFMRHDDEAHYFARLGGQHPLDGAYGPIKSIKPTIESSPPIAPTPAIRGG